MINREQVIEEIVTLANINKISIEELTAALSIHELKTNQKDYSVLMRIFSYLGGIFILSGLFICTGLIWGKLNSFSRISITLGFGIVCFILAIISASKNQKKSYVTGLIILSAIFQSAGLFVVAQELSINIIDAPITTLSIFGTLAIEYGIIFFKLRLTPLLFFTSYFAIAAFVILFSLIGIPGNFITLICGTSLFALSYNIQKTHFNSICGFSYFVSSMLLLLAGFNLIERTYLEVLYPGITCFMLYISTIVRSRSILANSTIALFLFICYFTGKYFLSSIGWPISLILLGFFFFGISNLALKLNKKFIN